MQQSSKWQTSILLTHSIPLIHKYILSHLPLWMPSLMHRQHRHGDLAYACERTNTYCTYTCTCFANCQFKKQHTQFSTFQLLPNINRARLTCAWFAKFTTFMSAWIRLKTNMIMSVLIGCSASAECRLTSSCITSNNRYSQNTVYSAHINWREIVTFGLRSGCLLLFRQN